jgi:hypothetical protein
MHFGEGQPPEARILLAPAAGGPNVIYGASPEFALTRIDDLLHPEAFLFVEDRQAEIWLREIIARHPEGSDLLSRVRIAAVGPSNVVKMMGQLAATQKLPYKALAVLDGDDTDANCVQLPGNSAPEKVVFEGLKARNWAQLHARFGVGAGDLHTYLDDAVLDSDFHRWPSKVGDRIVKSGVSVWETMATEWCKECLSVNDRDRIVAGIKAVLAT